MFHELDSRLCLKLLKRCYTFWDPESVFGVALLVLWRVLCVFAVGVVCRRFGLRVLFLILHYYYYGAVGVVCRRFGLRVLFLILSYGATGCPGVSMLIVVRGRAPA